MCWIQPPGWFGSGTEPTVESLREEPPLKPRIGLANRSIDLVQDDCFIVRFKKDSIEKSSTSRQGMVLAKLYQIPEVPI